MSSKRALIERMVRVDLAGEFGARRIYQGQLAALRGGDGSVAIQQMYDQEKEHYDKMKELIVTHRFRGYKMFCVFFGVC
jgi:ubiquinone biosynthesis monooxygenase Coq7